MVVQETGKRRRWYFSPGVVITWFEAPKRHFRIIPDDLSEDYISAAVLIPVAISSVNSVGPTCQQAALPRSFRSQPHGRMVLLKPFELRVCSILDNLVSACIAASSSLSGTEIDISHDNEISKPDQASQRTVQTNRTSTNV